MPKVNNLRTEDLTFEQLRDLFRAIDADPDEQAGTIMKMALFTGMRRGELFKLKWEDIDFGRGFIHIRDPKGGPNQIIPLDDAAREVLENHPRSDSPYVFPGRNGGRRVEVRNVMRIRDRAGLPKDFRPLHGLRHVYTSIGASTGQFDMYTLQKLLTHKSPEMTQRYAHLRDEAVKRAANIVANLIEEAAREKKPDSVVDLEE